MVLFILNPNAANEALLVAKQLGCAVWVGSDVLTDEEYRQHGEDGIKISRFIYSISNGDLEVLKDALSTIEEHHPGELIWVQHISL